MTLLLNYYCCFFCRYASNNPIPTEVDKLYDLTLELATPTFIGKKTRCEVWNNDDSIIESKPSISLPNTSATRPHLEEANNSSQEYMSARKVYIQKWM